MVSFIYVHPTSPRGFPDHIGGTLLFHINRQNPKLNPAYFRGLLLVIGYFFILMHKKVPYIAVFCVCDKKLPNLGAVFII